MSDSERQKLIEIFELAKRLSPVDRADLLERLHGTFESAEQAMVDQAWIVEAEERLKAYRTGELGSQPIEQVMDRLNKSTDS